MMGNRGKYKWHLALSSALLLGASASATSLAGDEGYANDWFKVSAGGSTIPMTGGAYGLAGTIGQWDVSSLGFLSGGDYVLLSGYWAAAVAAEPLPDELFSDRFESMSAVQTAIEPEMP